jgi:hypothetical protein
LFRSLGRVLVVKRLCVHAGIPLPPTPETCSQFRVTSKREGVGTRTRKGSTIGEAQPAASCKARNPRFPGSLFVRGGPHHH